MAKNVYLKPVVEVITLQCKTGMLGSSHYDVERNGNQDGNWNAW